MTAIEARRDLPHVSVRMPDGKVYPAAVTGRLNRFPTVAVRGFGGSPWINFQATWEQVARIATSGKPIVYA